MILLIDNYDSFTYNLYQGFVIAGADVKVVRNDAISIKEIEELKNLQGIVLSPGPGHPTDAGICIEVIQKLGHKIPIFGVCLGHQAIGAAFGGTVDLADKVMHGKSSLIFHNRNKLFSRVHLPFQAARYHSLVVKKNDLPNVLSVEAEDVDGNIMALSHREYPIYGVQFHPESILTPEGQQIINNFVEICNAKVK
ncbi:MAG: aminodeoxychorismate/anthranilate synthase component II [Neisseriales bacterium]|uniref:Aminodeoxychorismate/anthranilate synthase component II n=1 Tax=Aquella oligotrophica TaxID=2067065 RepID=A0A2I7N7F7_9NEIS|nr:aminodeoxychorismate/anthranilate synthase component II [Aquella oligotrophica]AUR52372.1 aminodeoxychorismate/anthranilate synthase component II [Aquella oligotrophica]TXI91866.1 MAG: aminodeoxychorismate/anthranilate synthase component II [Neisseriales bacterium]